MKTERHLAIFVFGLTAAAWVAGCNEGTWGSQPLALTVQEQLGNTDVPIPEGFEMDESASEDKSAGGWRYVRHIYKGKSDPQLVRAFYREQMPLCKWTMIDDEMRQGQYTQHFENDVETCEVVISRVNETWCTKTKLVIEVSPRGRGGAIKRAPSKS